MSFGNPAALAGAARFGLCTLALAQLSFGATLASAAASNDGNTTTPIKHVIVIIGENRSFDHVFATYAPASTDTVDNLLSKGIIRLDAGKNAVAGPNFSQAEQLAAKDLGGSDSFLLNPPKTPFPNNVLPAPLVGGPKVSYFPNRCAAGTPITQCSASLALAMQSETGLEPADYVGLLTGGTGQTSKIPDARITSVNNLPAGPFQLTNGKTFPYDAYAANPVHRFYQMWQQLDCSAERSTADNPSGCNGQLFSWVEVTVGAGTNGQAQPANFSTAYSPGATTTGEGATALGFYNMQQGDAPYFKSLADHYAMSDNFHQSVNGGTGVNHIMFGHGDMIYFTNPDGSPGEPPENQEIENPNPAKGTNNWYTEDGYGKSGNAAHKPPYSTASVSGGGSYSNCSDPSQPGVGEVLKYLASLPRPIRPNCEPGHYYLLNNYNPGFFGDGRNAYADHDPANTPFTVPPSTTPSIGDDLNAHAISWKYYGDQWNNYLADPYQVNYGTPGITADEYCNICNPFQYDISIMSKPDQIAKHIGDSASLYGDIAGGRLPAVSVVKPSGYLDGHPASSKLQLFEGFVKKIVDQVESSPYAKDTALIITFDEGGGFYDSGYVQPLDYFGDGTRIPLIVVSRYTRPGHISHDYGDHVSILKFIERNWHIPPVSNRSRDNHPNPVVTAKNPYVPQNSPAIGDLFDLFDFGSSGGLSNAR